MSMSACHRKKAATAYGPFLRHWTQHLGTWKSGPVCRKVMAKLTERAASGLTALRPGQQKRCCNICAFFGLRPQWTGFLPARQATDAASSTDLFWPLIRPTASALTLSTGLSETVTRYLNQTPFDATWLDATESQVAELGTAISAARRELISMLQTDIDADDDLGDHFPQAELLLEETIGDLLADHSAVDAEEAYRRLLAENRHRDASAGRTLDGPHRADLVVRQKVKQMPARLCSTGEQKALLIGIVLAHAKLVARLSGMIPIILLDEVAAHLDNHRRRALFDRIVDLNCQAWMTGTDRSLFDSLEERAHHFHVENGVVHPV